MLIALNDDARVKDVQSALQGLGLWTRRLETEDGQQALAVEPHSTAVSIERIRAVDGVAAVFRPASPHPRLDAQAGRALDLGPARIGGHEKPLLMAGPCAIESQEQVNEAAEIVKRAGGLFLRGGAYKPRTSPYSFSGHGEPALRWMRAAADRHGLGVITEALGEAGLDEVIAHADIIQIGTRNMQNFSLLKAVGQGGKPVLLKRGRAATIEEWLLAGEHVLAGGATAVIFCERGIQSFDPQTRNLLDLGAVALLKHVYKQPVIVDPSHATGRRDLIPHLARAGLAAGADGLLLEVHPRADEALSDGPQALSAGALIGLGQSLRRPREQVLELPQITVEAAGSSKGERS